MDLTSPEEIKRILTSKYGKIKTASGGWVRIACPTCNEKDSKKFKRYISLKNGYSKCFICETQVSSSALFGQDILFPKVPVSQQEEQKENPDARIWPCTKQVSLADLPDGHPALQFLAKDHLTDFKTYTEKYGIVYCPFDGGKNFGIATTAERLVVPVYYKKELVGWQARSIPGTFHGDKPDVVKYFHLFNKGKYLYNYDNAKDHEMVIVTEGVKKALKFPNGIATLGKGLTEAQISQIQEWKYITIMLDGEEKTQEKARQIADAIRLNGRMCINIDLRKYGYPSPDEAAQSHLYEIVEKEWNNYGRQS